MVFLRSIIQWKKSQLLFAKIFAYLSKYYKHVCGFSFKIVHRQIDQIVFKTV